MENPPPLNTPIVNNSATPEPTPGTMSIKSFYESNLSTHRDFIAHLKQSLKLEQTYSTILKELYTIKEERTQLQKSLQLAELEDHPLDEQLDIQKKIIKQYQKSEMMTEQLINTEKQIQAETSKRKGLEDSVNIYALIHIQ